MKSIRQQLIGVLLLMICAVPAQAVLIDFSTLSPGDSVEGLGTVHPLLNISSSQGSGVALFENLLPNTYTADNSSSTPVPNGNLSAGGGFGDIGADRLHDFVFTFAPGTTVTEFSLHMLDYGDLNPGGATQHTVILEAINRIGNIIDQSILSFTSDSAINPRSGSAGDLFFTGDAMTAAAGEPGNFLFSVSGAHIAMVRLLYIHNGELAGASDPNIAFDTLNVNFVPVPGAVWLFGSGLLGLAGIARRRRA